MTITLYNNYYDMHDNIVETRAFDVDTEWLVKYLESDFYSIPEFLDEYTSEESMEIYAGAILDNAIVREWSC